MRPTVNREVEGSSPSGGALTIWIRSDIVLFVSVSRLNSALSKRVENFSDFDLQTRKTCGTLVT